MASKAIKRAEQFKAEVIRQSKIDAYAVRIEKSWQKTLESIFAVGDLIIEAKKELTTSEYRLLLNNLSFGVRAANRLRCVAEDKRLRKISDPPPISLSH